MSRRNRPSAFEVSFPDEAAALAAQEEELRNPPQLLHKKPTISVPRGSPAELAASALKRKAVDDAADPRRAKRLQRPKVAYYNIPRVPSPVVESYMLYLPGEDPDDEEGEGESKPIRVLHDFVVYDPSHRNEMLSLSTLEEVDGRDRQFEAIGTVYAHFLDDEDEGQEEAEKEGVLVRLSAVLRYSIDYTSQDEPFYIETEFAWYILKSPKKIYEPFYRHFYTPNHIAQFIASTALRRPQTSYQAFLQKFTSLVDMFGRTYLEEHIYESILELRDIIYEEDDYDRIIQAPFVREIMRSAPSKKRTTTRRRDPTAIRNLPKRKLLKGNVDIAVLKPENQNQTHVTAFVASLSDGLVQENMFIVGHRPPVKLKDKVELEREETLSRIRQLVRRAQMSRPKIDYSKQDRIPGTDFYHSAKIEDETYEVGDSIVVAASGNELWTSVMSSEKNIPSDARLDDYFWFARIMYFDMDKYEVHLQWFDHGANTVLEELAHPQELFLLNMCGSEDIKKILGKVKVHHSSGTLTPSDEFFYKFVWNDTDSSFISINVKQLDMFSSMEPPNNCPVCGLHNQQAQTESARFVKDDSGITNGIAIGTQVFHFEDFVLYRSGDPESPAHLGYITNLKGKDAVRISKVGRISDLAVLPPGAVRDERHLFLTNENAVVPTSDLIKVIYVVCEKSFQPFIPPKSTLADWLELSYDHFYVTWRFLVLMPERWADREELDYDDVKVCTPCYEERLSGRLSMYKFLLEREQHPLPTLDLFAGVGAFSGGLAEGSGCLEVTHAIEISPSACKTFKKNSPDTVVYNQCANIMLKYAIKTEEKMSMDTPKELGNDDHLVPPPPPKGIIKVISAGFPCQTHSSLNMYKTADDIKSNLILNTLSWIDFYLPEYVFLENVPGFLQYCLSATQTTRHRVEGGIDKGGLKLVLRALIDLGYQVRYGLLQAAHYGTPQRRIRFFLVAARDGGVLPDMPKPTHHFASTGLGIKIREKSFEAVPKTSGIAMHRTVSIADAISDLPRFDWRHPKPATDPNRRERQRREERVPALECKKSDPHTGLDVEYEYHHPPRNSYQIAARKAPVTRLQQFTRTFIPKKVERVINIPLNPLADYRSLPPRLQEWQIIDPSSSIGRKNFRAGPYGRPDKKGVFQTTVTNMEPTAKQSYVLNPYCHRVFSVRELARSQGFPDSFVFKAIDNNVVTMHRQIGNAVPLPVAHALGRSLRKALFEKWKENRQDAILIEDEDEDEDMYAEVS